MGPRPQQGILVLADVSGFTAFLASTELEHAHDVLAELLQLIIEGLRPSLTLAEVEGDAVFAYGAAETFTPGSTLLDLIDRTYAAFHGRVEAIRRHTTCSCSACRAIPTLDLKFIVHYGRFVLQAVAGPGKPLGSDVNLAHRLLKNHIAETTGWRAYALLTEEAVRALAIDPSGMLMHSEAYPEFPRVSTFSHDLHRRWQDQRRTREVRLSDEETDLELVVDLPAPPDVVWDWLNDPMRRSRWVGMTFSPPAADGARNGVGTISHCTHGDKLESVHTILDWQPLDYFTEEISRPRDGQPQAINTIVLEPIENGTRLRSRFRVLVRPRVLTVPYFRRAAGGELRAGLATLQRLLNEIAAAPDRDI